MSFENCLKKGLLKRTEPQKDLSEKEFLIAKNDLDVSKRSLEEGNFVWSIIQGYYSMFHAAKGVLYLIGIKERSHFCVAEALAKLSEKGLLEMFFVEEFKSCLESRINANYEFVYSPEEASRVVELAANFLEKMKELSKKVKPNEI